MRNFWRSALLVNKRQNVSTSGFRFQSLQPKKYISAVPLKLLTCDICLTESTVNSLSRIYRLIKLNDTPIWIRWLFPISLHNRKPGFWSAPASPSLFLSLSLSVSVLSLSLSVPLSRWRPRTCTHSCAHLVIAAAAWRTDERSTQPTTQSRQYKVPQFSACFTSFYGGTPRQALFLWMIWAIYK